MRLVTQIGFMSCAAAVAAGVAWGVWIRPKVIIGKQVRTWADISTYAAFVRAYRVAHGSMPRSLQEAVPENEHDRRNYLPAQDVWGHPLHYEASADRFLIASFGRDGVRDSRAYAHEGDEPSRIAAPCGDANVDTAYSSDGVFQACAK